MSASSEQLQIRVYGEPDLPTLTYLPGLHGDWTLITAFRLALAGRVRFVEVTYPRSLTWSLADYTNAVRESLAAHGIEHGWVLGESWGSQLAWTLIDLNLGTAAQERAFRVEGLILAGGFVKHPWKYGPRLLGWIGEHTPQRWYQLELKCYSLYARLRHEHTPEVRESIREFIARRTDLDRQAMRERLKLLDDFDPAPTARRTEVPVYYIAGLLDPLVPGVQVCGWLRKNCPGYRGCKIFWGADHNVLATAPRRAAEWVMRWMQGADSLSP